VDLSFAGQFATFLNVRGLEPVADRVKDCWASAFSERSLHYRIRHGLAVRDVGVAVVVQQMIPADTSGVLFSVNPTNGRRDESVISSVYGLGEGLVSGTVDADTIVIDRASGAVRSVVVGAKEERYDPRVDGQGLVAFEVSEEARGRLALEPEETNRLHSAAGRVEEIFQAPQDIEWAFAGGRLWMLQSRPITTLAAGPREHPVPVHPPVGELRVWDNSNIIESFSDITSPLTYSFARHAYQRVYE